MTSDWSFVVTAPDQQEMAAYEPELSHHHVEPLTHIHVNAADFMGVEVHDPTERSPRPTRRSVVTQLEALPQTVFAGANRYDSEDGGWLHLWTADGQSFDIVWRHKR